MNRIFIDTSAWYAFIDKNDPDHKESEKLYKSNTKPLITSNFIFDESVTLLMSRLGFDIAVKFGESLKKSNFVNIIRITDEDEDSAWRIFLKYKLRVRLYGLHEFCRNAQAENRYGIYFR